MRKNLLHLSIWKKGTWLFRVYVGDDELPSYVGIILENHEIWIPMKNQPVFFVLEFSPAVFFSVAQMTLINDVLVFPCKGDTHRLHLVFRDYPPRVSGVPIPPVPPWFPKGSLATKIGWSISGPCIEVNQLGRIVANKNSWGQISLETTGLRFQPLNHGKSPLNS